MAAPVDKAELKQAALELCLDTSCDLWEVADEVERNLASKGEVTRKAVLDASREVATELVMAGLMRAFARDEYGPDSPVQPAAVPAALADYANWHAPVGVPKRVYSLLTTPAGRELYASKRLLSDPGVR